MKKIILNDNIRFSKCRVNSNYQYCSYCGKRIGKGNLGLCISKKCSVTLNVWIHIKCIEKFSKAIIKFKKDNIRKILMESL